MLCYSNGTDNKCTKNGSKLGHNSMGFDATCKGNEETVPELPVPQAASLWLPVPQIFPPEDSNSEIAARLRYQ